MGIYLNPGDELFWQAAHSEIYVDKTGLLNYTNTVLRTSLKYLCVSRPGASANPWRPTWLLPTTTAPWMQAVPS